MYIHIPKYPESSCTVPFPHHHMSVYHRSQLILIFIHTCIYIYIHIYYIIIFWAHACSRPLTFLSAIAIAARCKFPWILLFGTVMLLILEELCCSHLRGAAAVWRPAREGPSMKRKRGPQSCRNDFFLRSPNMSLQLRIQSNT